MSPREPGRRRHPVASVLVIVVCVAGGLLVFDATSSPHPAGLSRAVGVVFALLIVVALVGMLAIIVRGRRDR